MKYKHLFLTRLQGWGGGQVSPLPTPTLVDTEFRRLCELGIFGINVIKICNFLV